MAKCSPKCWPAQKTRVSRPRLMAQSKSIPPTSHNTLRISGPRMTAAKAVPTRRNPTTLLTPEQAEITLRLKGRPLWTIVNTAVFCPPSGVAT